ncbi:MAG: prephenate dehydrogenase [Thermoproteus sp.]|nr:prephenate dehydrogenase [Thermoproteus sp.]
MRVGIVGGGRMGTWLGREVSLLHEVKVFDVDPAKSDVPSLASLASWSDVIVVAVGFKEAAAVVRDLSSLDLCGKLVIDIATFKRYVVEAYDSLPECALAATAHPLFGPGAATIKGRRVVVMGIPGRRGVKEAASFFAELGATVVEGSLDEHDEYVEYTIALSYAVGLALARVYSKRWDKLEKYGGTSFRYLSVFAASLLSDQTAPSYAEEAREALEEFIEELRKSHVPRPPSGYEDAYQLFYRALEAIGY